MSSPVVQTCRECLGDPRASLRCRVCKGAGVFYPTEEGVLVWKPIIDGFFFAFREGKRVFHRAVQLLLLLVILACFATWGGYWMMRGDIKLLLAPTTWVAGHWSMSAWWLGWFAVCFLIFYVKAFSDQALALPTWLSQRRDKTDEKALIDVSLYVQPAVWSLLEEAHALAIQTNRAEVEPVHLFAAALSSPAGGIFMTRLGVQMETLREGLVALLREGRNGSPVVLSTGAKTVLLSSYLMARENRRKHVGVIEVFVQGFLADERLQTLFDTLGFPLEHVTRVAQWVRLQEQLREDHDRFAALAQQKPNSGMNRLMTARQTALLDRFSEDLTLMARNGYLMPAVCREEEMGELLRVIESGRGGVVLVGEPGTGKTAIVETLARRMVEENVPPSLFDRRLVSVHLAALLAAGESGKALERLLNMLREAALSGNIVLVLEGIEALVGGAGAGGMDLAEALASEIDKGYFFVVATTTPAAWTGYLERRTLGNKLVKVQVKELSQEAVLEVLMAKSGFIEYETKVFFSYAALERAVQLGMRYLHDQRMPEAAIDLVREAAILARNERGEHILVSAEDVARIVQAKTSIPVEAISQDESQKLLHLEEKLHTHVIGQGEAVNAVAQAMRRARADIREHTRPIANFLFLGPTGVGKTELTKALALEYFGSAEAMIRLDMSEYQHPSSVARIIGEPGNERGGLLTEAVRRQPFTIVLLDELEKAHPDILTLFLQVMDDGRLTDGVGRTVDFTNTVLIATSNAGTTFIQDQIKMGATLEHIKTGLLESELKEVFRPEFLNRFDGVIVFKPLTLEDVRQIAGLLLQSMAVRLAERGMGFRVEAEAIDEFVQAGFDPLYGARPLRRVIQERVENALADALLRKDIGRRDTIVVRAGGTLEIERGTFVPT